MSAEDSGGRKAGEPVGRVLSVHGSQAGIGLFVGIPPTAENEQDETPATVGKFLGIRRGRSLLIGVISDVSMEVPILAREYGYRANASVDLMGEITDANDPRSKHFERGVKQYPAIGDPAYRLSHSELQTIYDMQASATVEVGQLQQDATITARVNVREMMNKHFALLGSTGVGKSSGVALLLPKILSALPDLRIFLLDGHNEYGQCFGDRALVLNPGNLKLPFWLFTFDEMIEVMFGGRSGHDEEIEILAELIPLAKGLYSQATERPSLRRTDPKSTGYTIDTPVPYRLQDLLALIDEQMGKLENRSSRMNYRRLMTRIEMVSNDPRYAFMFEKANVGGDTMADLLRHLFRWRADGKPMTIMQLAGFPSEVVDAMVSVLCRMAFDVGLWSDGALQLLVVCEEAHRYISADRSLGFLPTRSALSRIAKEGRKYGIFLGLVTQRPAELDATIISQCSTLFAMRMATDRDQELVRAAVSDAAANLLSFLPSLGTREVLAFGPGVALPTRFTFPQLPDHLIPRSEAVNRGRLTAEVATDNRLIEAVVEKWRGVTAGKLEETR
jgi:DNA helicase HerA-like ATPase